MKRKVCVPPEVHSALRVTPGALVIRTLNKFEEALTVIPTPVKKDWVEVTLEASNCLARFSDNQIRNLLCLVYMAKPPEYCYRNFVAGLYPYSKVEVITQAGIVDVMTPDLVIEVKVSSDWKHALGQVLAYSHVTAKTPKVALFGDVPDIARDVLLVLGVGLIEL